MNPAASIVRACSLLARARGQTEIAELLDDALACLADQDERRASERDRWRRRRDTLRGDSGGVTAQTPAESPLSLSDLKSPEREQGGAGGTDAAPPPESEVRIRIPAQSRDVVTLDLPFTPELAAIAAKHGVRDGPRCWAKFLGHYLGQRMVILGKWAKWCASEREPDPRQLELPHATDSPERLRERERRRDEAFAKVRAAAVPMPPDFLAMLRPPVTIHPKTRKGDSHEVQESAVAEGSG